MLRILLLDVNCKSGSTGKLVYALYDRLRCEGFDAAIGYGRGRVVKGSNISKFAFDIETHWHALMTRLTGLTGCYSYFSTRRLVRLIESFRPDVVHMNDMHGYFVNISSLVKYLKRYKIRTIWTFHCEFMYTGKCGLAYECKKWQSECGSCPQVRAYPSSLVFDFSKEMFNAKKALFDEFENLSIVTPSVWLKRRVRLSFLNGKDISTIFNGIDTEETFVPRRVNNLRLKHGLGKEKVVLAVAPDIMNREKGGQYVLALARRMESENVKFILIGVRGLRQEFGQNVIALGRIENQVELAEYYSMADCTLLTSRVETFSMVCAESLACGTPVIGFYAGAPSEIAPPGYGFFVDYPDLDKLTMAVRTFDRNKIFRTSSELTEFAKSKYSIAAMYKEYKKLYLSTAAPERQDKGGDNS